MGSRTLGHAGGPMSTATNLTLVASVSFSFAKYSALDRVVSPDHNGNTHINEAGSRHSSSCRRVTIKGPIQ